MSPRVVIVGAGPAGAMAARRLAETGMAVLVLDRARFPREKACGGAVTGTAAIPFGELGAPVEATVEKSVNYFAHRMEKVQALAQPIHFVDRRRFDAHLIETALGRPGNRLRFRDRFEVHGVRETADRVMVYGRRGETIPAEFVILADGARGAATASLGWSPKAPVGIAVDAEISVSETVLRRHRDFAVFHFACIPSGYGWIFPKSGYLSCGVGSRAPRVRILAELARFLKRIFPEDRFRVVHRRVHPVPGYSGCRKLASNRIFLAGDAASLVNPLTGEGIRYALASGDLAAQEVIQIASEGMRPGRAPDRTYAERIWNRFGRDFEILYRLALPDLLDAPEFFYRTFCMQERNPTDLYRIMADRLRMFRRRPEENRFVTGQEKIEGLDGT